MVATRNTPTSGFWFALVGTGVSIITASVLWNRSLETQDDALPEIKIPKRRPRAREPDRPQSSRRVSVDDLFAQAHDEPKDVLVTLLDLCGSASRRLRSLHIADEGVVLTLGEIASVTTSLCRLQNAITQDTFIMPKGSPRHICFEAVTSALSGAMKHIEHNLGSPDDAEMEQGQALTPTLRCLQDQRPALSFLLQDTAGTPNFPPSPPPETELEHTRCISARSSSILSPRVDSATWLEPPPQYTSSHWMDASPVAKESKSRTSFPPELDLVVTSTRKHAAQVLYDAVTANDIALVRDLLMNGMGLDPNKRVGDLERTALHHAAQLNHIQCVTLLIQHGSDMTAEDADGHTPLHLAAWCGHCETMSTLLSHGADINYLSGRDCFTPLLCAVNSANAAAVSILIKFGADVTVRAAAGGLTALHQAASMAHSAMCEVLLQQDQSRVADVVNALDDDAQTALHSACAAGSDACVRLLLQHGAHTDVRQRSDGVTPLHIAAYTNSTSIVKRLIDHGADVNAAAVGGSTALHLAVSRGRVEAVKYLLAHRGVERKTKAAWNGVQGTPSQFARDRGFSKLAKLIETWPKS